MNDNIAHRCNRLITSCGGDTTARIIAAILCLPKSDVPEATLDLTELVSKYKKSIHIYAFLAVCFPQILQHRCAQLMPLFIVHVSLMATKGVTFSLSN